MKGGKPAPGTTQNREKAAIRPLFHWGKRTSAALASLACPRSRSEPRPLPALAKVFSHPFNPAPACFVVVRTRLALGNLDQRFCRQLRYVKSSGPPDAVTMCNHVQWERSSSNAQTLPVLSRMVGRRHL
jgi:hypothetical protein